jgi:hypothetical protein
MKPRRKLGYAFEMAFFLSAAALAALLAYRNMEWMEAPENRWTMLCISLPAAAILPLFARLVCFLGGMIAGAT